MACTECVQIFSGIAGVASAYKTLVQLLAPTNQRVRIKAVRLGTTGIVGTDPEVLVQLALQTSAGTGGVSGTPACLEDEIGSTLTIQTTTLTGPTAAGAWTAEPTTTTVKYQDSIHPQGRIPENWIYPDRLILKAGTRLGLRVNVQSGATQAFYGAVYFEE